MTATPTTRTVPDLVAHLPEIFGYYPGDSVVLVATTTEGRLIMCARCDREALVPLKPEALAGFFAAAYSRQVSGVVVVSYHPGETSESLQPLTRALTEAGLSLVDVGHVDAGVWESLHTGARCALPVPESVPAYSRAALSMSLQPMGADALSAALDAEPTPTDARRVAAALEAWAGMLRGSAEPTDAALLTALPLLRSVSCRDALMATIVGDPGLTAADIVDDETAERMTRTLPGTPDPHLCASLSRICHATPPQHAPDVLALAGICHLTIGNGTQATLLAEHAQRIDPGHVLAGLVAQMAALAVSPVFPG